MLELLHGPGAPMREHLGEPKGAARLMRAVETVCTDGITTPDVGGPATTREVTQSRGAATSSRSRRRQ